MGDHLGGILVDLNLVSGKQAHPEGFEPPTTWFEAKYSIQPELSMM